MSWTDGSHRRRAETWNALVLNALVLNVLVLPDGKPGDPTFRVVALYDPRYGQPLLLASSLNVSVPTLWRLDRDRWAGDRWSGEQLPLSAKPMLGAERAFVFGAESRYRLPELALLAGSLLSYVAATRTPASSG